MSASRIVVISSVAGVVGVPFRTLHLGAHPGPLGFRGLGKLLQIVIMVKGRKLQNETQEEEIPWRFLFEIILSFIVSDLNALAKNVSDLWNAFI